MTEPVWCQVIRCDDRPTRRGSVLWKFMVKFVEHNSEAMSYYADLSTFDPFAAETMHRAHNEQRRVAVTFRRSPRFSGYDLLSCEIGKRSV